MSSGGNSVGPIARADFGARVTGEASPVLENMAASSALIRRDVADKSSFRENAGLWREEIDIADGRRPDKEDELGAGGEAWMLAMVASSFILRVFGRDTSASLGGSLADSTLCFSLRRSRCKTAMARS